MGVEDDEVNTNSLTYDELLDFIEELHDNFQKIISKQYFLEKSNKCLLNENDVLKNENEILKNENETIKLKMKL